MGADGQSSTRVYVSAPLHGLEHERQEVLTWLDTAGFHAIHSYRADAASVHRSCVADVAGCDLYVLVLGWRYGTRPGDDNPEGLSVTHLEFREAARRGIPRIVLLQKGIADVEDSDIRHPDLGPRISAFRNEVRAEVRPAEFTDLLSLIRELSAGVSVAAERLRGNRDESPRTPVGANPSRPEAAEAPATDVFISYTGTDVDWAEWIAVTLQDEGFRVELQKREIRSNPQFAEFMHHATRSSRRSIAIVSPEYLRVTAGDPEWLVTLTSPRRSGGRRLIPVEVAECRPTGLFADLVAVSLVHAEEEAARELLLAGVELRPRPGSGDSDKSSEARDPRRDRPNFPGRAGSAEASAPEIGTRVEDVPGAANERARGRPGRERTPWEWLATRRPILDSSGDLVGHRTVQERLTARLTSPETAAVVYLIGPAGSGKSSLLRTLAAVVGDRIVDAGAVARGLKPELFPPDGSKLYRLLKPLQPLVSAAGDHAIVVFDDVDHHLRDGAIINFVKEAIEKPGVGFVVLTMSTALTPHLYTFPVTDLPLNRRAADPDEFDHYLARVLDSVQVRPSVLDENLRKSLYDLAEQTTDFRAVQYVLEMLLAFHQHWSPRDLRPAELRQLLAFDMGARRRPLPAVRSHRGEKLTFRRKDKSELLADVLLRHFRTPEALAAKASTLDDFDVVPFAEDAAQSFVEAVLSLCLTYSPRELVLLLTSEQIRTEITALHLDPRKLFADRADEPDLLVRGLGFTFVGSPTSMTSYAEAVQEARGRIELDESEVPNLNAAGLAIIDHVQSALLDVLHFWARYLSGSVRDLTEELNAERATGEAIDWRHLEPRHIIDILRYLERSAGADSSTYRLTIPGRPPVSQRLLAACDAFVVAAEAFLAAHRGPTSDAQIRDHRARCAVLATAATEVLEEGEGSFPAVIKLSEIVFDEYGRKIFHGVDSDGRDVRFAMTGDEDREELVVAAHYFMLPRKSVSVNPHVVPRGGAGAPALFQHAEEYEAASETQRLQAAPLLAALGSVLRPQDTVLDVGSGTGWLAVDLAPQVRSVHGIDSSSAMVRRAREVARAAGTTNVVFQTADVLKYHPTTTYDVVLSNATMHWIRPEQAAYGQLFQLLRPGGRLAVHQGGHGTYDGLHQFTQELLADLGLRDFFHNFDYGTYYPTADRLRELLQHIGFANITVDSMTSDGRELPTLVRDFSRAGLLPYLRVLPERHKEVFLAEWLEEAEDAVTNRYTHRLYATATRPSAGAAIPDDTGSAG